MCDSYGYEIIKTIFQNSNQQYVLKEPSLYTSLKRLEKEISIRKRIKIDYELPMGEDYSEFIGNIISSSNRL